MDEKRKISYDIAYMKMARVMSELSYAKRHKVGAVIVSSQGQIISQGFNGTPPGYDNCCEYEDENGNLVTYPYVLHAESNAITKCARWNSSTEGGTLYVTLSPCIDCARLIIQAGIKRVVYDEQYRNDEGIKLLIDVGMTIDHIDIENNKIINVSK